jgi:hypothetical protein
MIAIMAKKRSLTDDVATLKKKIRTSVTSDDGGEKPHGDANIRSMRKRLKRGLRKLRMVKRRAEGPKAKKAGAEK